MVVWSQSVFTMFDPAGIAASLRQPVGHRWATRAAEAVRSEELPEAEEAAAES
jgi:hypothetical protein